MKLQTFLRKSVLLGHVYSKYASVAEAITDSLLSIYTMQRKTIKGGRKVNDRKQPRRYNCSFLGKEMINI